MSHSSQMRTTAEYRQFNDEVEKKNGTNVLAEIRGKLVRDQEEKCLRLLRRLGAASSRIEPQVAAEVLHAARKLVDLENK